MRTKVILHGAMARAVGRAEWEFELESPVDAFRAIEANTNKMMSHLYENLETQYRILLDGKDITYYQELDMNNAKEIEILPLLKGEGGSSGGFLVLIGLAIVAAVLLPGLGGGFATLAAGGTLSTTATLALTVGLTLTLGGIAQMLAPTPSNNESEKVENRPSYIYNGPINTYRQGNPVPFAAGGPMLVGSQVISAGIRSKEIFPI